MKLLRLGKLPKKHATKYQCYNCSSILLVDDEDVIVKDHEVVSSMTFICPICKEENAVKIEQQIRIKERNRILEARSNLNKK